MLVIDLGVFLFPWPFFTLSTFNHDRWSSILLLGDILLPILGQHANDDPTMEMGNGLGSRLHPTMYRACAAAFAAMASFSAFTSAALAFATAAVTLSATAFC